MAEKPNKGRKAGKSTKRREPAAYRDCVVTFIDILGFRNIVKSQSPEEIQQIVDLVQQHAGSSDGAIAKEYGITDDVPWTRTIFFSDAVVRVRPYDGKIYDGSLFRELLELVHAQAELANRGIFIRGGLTVGGLHLRDDVLFGPAMVKAYDLESQFANYPRIVVDREAIAALMKDERLRFEDHDLNEERGFIRKLLRRGEDGLHYVDYLGAFRTEMDDDAAFPDFLARLKKRIVDNAQEAKNNLGVLQKYLWMARYLNAVAKRFEDCKDNQNVLISERDIAELTEI